MLQQLASYFAKDATFGILFRKLLLVLVLQVVSRLLLFVFNPSVFPDIGSGELLQYLLIGVRFDLVPLGYANALYVLLFILPFAFIRERRTQRILNVLFLVSNLIFLAPNMIDVGYFPYTMRRMDVSIFAFIGTGNDVWHLLPRFMADFWYLLLIWLFFGWLLWFANKRWQVAQTFSKPNYVRVIAAVLVTAFLMLTAMRGGWQRRPISPLHAAAYVPAKHIPLVSNSSLSILISVVVKQLTHQTYFESLEEAERVFSPLKKYDRRDSLGIPLAAKKQNVVLIILEGFSVEHIGALNGLKPESGFTPFLDSLIGQSLCFTGFANGKRSIEGIPAITASLPAWMPNDFITSSYAENSIDGLASVLKNEGYQTTFYHGGENGTLDFDVFAKSAGYETYIGKNEYPNPADFDGYWGIWDEPFLQFSAQKMNASQQPFFATIFTLTSHHPYRIPSAYQNKFPKGPIEVQQCIAYSDYALRRFFETAKKTDWFAQTLFVITADHTSVAHDAFYQSSIGQHRVPILFYHPDGSLKGRPQMLVQHTDIMPSVIDYLHIAKPFVAFGNSVFDSTAMRFGMYYANGMWHFQNDNYFLMWDGEKTNALFDLRVDSLLKRNIISTPPKELPLLEKRVKSIVQGYSTRMLDNKLNVR